MRCERRQGWLLVLVLCWPVDSSRPVVRLPSVGVVGGSGGIPFADMAMRRRELGTACTRWASRTPCVGGNVGVER